MNETNIKLAKDLTVGNVIRKTHPERNGQWWTIKGLNRILHPGYTLLSLVDLDSTDELNTFCKNNKKVDILA